MRIIPIFTALALATTLSGCMDNDGERALAGAAAGAVTAQAFDGNPVTGALIGAAGGALCDDANLCN